MRVMTISDSPTICTGMARVHRHVVDALSEAGHSVLPCGWFAYESDVLQRIKQGEKGPPVHYKSTSEEIRVLPVPKGNGMNCMYAAFDAIGLFKPDVVVTLGDLWDFFYLQSVKAKTGFSFKWLAWLNVEQDEVGEEWVPLLRYADGILVPSQFGKDVLAKAGFAAELVPYGVEPAFRRLPDERRAALREARGCGDKVRFITVGQNTWRKNLPCLLQGIQLAKREDPEDKLRFYVHTNAEKGDPQEAFLYDVRRIAEKLGISGCVSFPEKPCSVYDSPSDEAMAEEYNASDFFVLTSTCEGFCFPVLEAMACGVPVLAHRTSAVAEHVSAERGRGIVGRTEIVPPARIVRMAEPEGVARAILALCEEVGVPPGHPGSQKSSLLKGMREACMEYAKWKAWPRTKASFLEALGRAVEGQGIPVEEL